MNSTLSKIRLLGFVEAVSFLVLLLIAMPLKYMFDMPIGVRIVGMTHGFLFVGFVMGLLYAWTSDLINGKRMGMGVVAAVIPCGPFFLDKRIFDSADSTTPDQAD